MVVRVDRSKCLYCGACVSLCPQDAIELMETHIIIDEKVCTSCLICARFCPVGAIYEKKTDDGQTI
ncbi:MAG: ferredoxin [Candidatus Altiarchaeales archaeon ex4484_96]|nr:MAG: ferredoxin [Candidatus Altiarchaeales archaeon ex4484_96]